MLDLVLQALVRLSGREIGYAADLAPPSTGRISHLNSTLSFRQSMCRGWVPRNCLQFTTFAKNGAGPYHQNDEPSINTIRKLRLIGPLITPDDAPIQPNLNDRPRALLGAGSRPDGPFQDRQAPSCSCAICSAPCRASS
jgi:hypothetical protein